MANITLPVLIRMTKFSEDFKKELLGKLDILSEDQKYEISMICWEALAKENDYELIEEIDKITDAADLEGKPYDTKKIRELRDQQDLKFSQKAEKANQEIEMEKLQSSIAQSGININSQTPNPANS